MFKNLISNGHFNYNNNHLLLTLTIFRYMYNLIKKQGRNSKIKPQSSKFNMT